MPVSVASGTHCIMGRRPDEKDYIPKVARIFISVWGFQPGSGFHAASDTEGNGDVFCGIEGIGVVKPNTDLHLVARLTLRGALPSPTHTGSCFVSQSSKEPNYPHNNFISGSRTWRFHRPPVLCHNARLQGHKAIAFSPEYAPWEI